MSGFDALPEEIVQKIVQLYAELPPTDARVRRLRELRLVSRRLYSLVTPILFPRFTILTGTRPSLAHCAEIRAALTQGTPAAFQHLRKLYLNTSIFYLDTQDGRPWFILMESLIPALCNVSELRWVYDLSTRTFPEGAIEKLSSSLALLPNLRVLDLTLSARDDPLIDGFSLGPLSHLTTFAVTWDCRTTPHARILSQISSIVGRCPDLETFSFRITFAYYFDLRQNQGPSVTFEEIFGTSSSLPQDMKLISLETHGVTVTVNEFQRHVRHFRCLTRLHIRLDPSPAAATNIGEILQILTTSRVFLKDISVDAIYHPAVFSYLTSFSGIERLALRPGHPLDDSRELIDQFFLTVLPVLSSSLRWLSVGGNRATQWTKPLPAGHLREVEKCQLLEYICCWIAIIPGDVIPVRSEALVGWLETATRVPKLHCISCRPIQNDFTAWAERQHDSPKGPAHLLRAVVEKFRRSNANIKFSIDISTE